MAVARRLRAFVFVFSAVCLTLPAVAAEKPRVQVDSYAINADLNPKTHHLLAAARLKFTALDDINSASFELNNALRPRVLDEAGKPLAIERISQENLVRVNFPKTIAKGDSQTITFEYDGELANADESPVEGLKLSLRRRADLVSSLRWPLVPYRRLWSESLHRRHQHHRAYRHDRDRQRPRAFRDLGHRQAAWQDHLYILVDQTQLSRHASSPETSKARHSSPAA